MSAFVIGATCRAKFFIARCKESESPGESGTFSNACRVRPRGTSACGRSNDRLTRSKMACRGVPRGKARR